MAKAEKKLELYGLDPAFERNVVALACSRTSFYGVIGHAIEADLLDAAPARLAMQAVKAFAADVGHGPDSSILVMQRLKRWTQDGKISKEQVMDVLAYLDEADDAGIMSEDNVVKELTPVLSRRKLHDAVMAAMDEYSNKGDFERVQTLINEAARMGVSDLSLGTRVGSASFTEIERLKNMERMPMGIMELDTELDGGLPRGSLGCVVGWPGDGKSMFLNHVAGQAVLNGLHVVYATLELPAPIILARLYSNLTNIPINSIMDGAMNVARERMERLEDEIGIGCGVVKYFTPQATTIEDIKDWVKFCEDKESKKVDAVIIDYADKMAAPSEKSDYTAMRTVYEGLRIFVESTGKWGWTASQAKAPGKDKKQRLEIHHAADSMHKSRVVDLMITLNPKDEGAMMDFFVGKFRFGKSKFHVGPLPVDYTCGRIAPIVTPFETPVQKR